MDFLGEKRMSMRIAPAVGFVVLSTVVIVALPEGQYKQWLFYSMRQVFLLWCLGTCSCATAPPKARSRRRDCAVTSLCS